MPYIGRTPLTGAYQLCDTITTSATATYNLLVGGSAVIPGSANNCIVSLNGVVQAPVGAFTVSGSQITFASALTASDVIDFILILGNVFDIGTPTNGAVTNSSLNSNVITGQTAETSVAGGDLVLLYDDSASALRKMTRTNFVAGLTGGTQEFAAGTVSLPSITTTGDTNTGVFFPAADTIAFTTGGAESMRMIAARNLRFPALASGSGASNTAYLLDTTYPNALIFVAGQENLPVNMSFYMGIAVRSASTYTLTQIAKPAHGNGFGTVNVGMNGNYLDISFAAGSGNYAVNVMYFFG